MAELDKKIIGERLKSFLNSKFPSIDKAGEALGTTGNTLRATYINGKSLPGAEMIYKLLLIGCDVQWLFDGTEVKSNNDNLNFTETIIDYLPTASKSIIMTNLEAAAGGGCINPEEITNEGVISVPNHLIKHNGTYLAVRIKGNSMAPTLLDSGYAVIRLINQNDWYSIKDDYVYVISATDGNTYLKRIKDRLKQGFLVLMSDNPDKIVNPNFNLKLNEITSIWQLEWYISAKTPNIHKQYYNKLELLEQRFEALEQKVEMKLLNS